MIIIISGATHTGKTNLAQKLLEKYKYPYLSIDHLKMGLIRSGNTLLTPYSSDKDLTNYLWPIVREIIKTAIENNQNLIVEGCYIPYNYKEFFTDDYLKEIKCIFLVMSKNYIENNFDDILKYGNIIENRLEEKINKDNLINDNLEVLNACEKYKLKFYMINEKYDLNIEIGDIDE